MNEWLNEYSTLIWTILLNFSTRFCTILINFMFVCLFMMVTALKFKNETGLLKSNI